MLVTSIFSFSHYVFKRSFPQGRQKPSLCHKGLTLHHTIPTFNDPEKKSIFKTLLEKEKILITNLFSFSHNVFHPFKIKSICHLQMFWTILKFCHLIKPAQADHSRNFSVLADFLLIK